MWSVLGQASGMVCGISVSQPDFTPCTHRQLCSSKEGGFAVIAGW